VIAGRYGLSVDELVRANPSLEPDRLSEGQWIAIPERPATEWAARASLPFLRDAVERP
jgi:hypothetical protein